MEREEKMVVALAGCSHALSHGYLLIFPAVLLLLQKEFSLNYLQLGIVGNIMTLTYGLGAFPGGLIYNRIGPKRLYLICFLGSAFSLALVAVSPNLAVFTIGVALLGALGSVYHPLINALITSKVRQYGKALGIHGSAGNVGLATAPLVAGLIASRLGWRNTYLWFILPGVALSIWSLFINMSPREEMKAPSSNPGRSLGLPRNIKAYFSLPLVWLYLINTFNAFCFYGSSTFLPTYMAQRTSFRLFSLDKVAMGGMLSGIVLFMGVLGQLSGGLLSQKPFLEKNFLLISIIAFPFILAMSFTTNLLLLILALIYFFFIFCLQPMNNVLLAQYTTLDMRGTAFGLYFSISFALGSLASSFSGFIAQKFGLQWVFLGLSASSLLMIVFIFFLQGIHKPNYGSA